MSPELQADCGRMPIERDCPMLPCKAYKQRVDSFLYRACPSCWVEACYALWLLLSRRLIIWPASHRNVVALASGSGWLQTQALDVMITVIDVILPSGFGSQ
eukprot:m.30692 g.30692  ORF g.30692 m.30692 type:complete len:101 (+) comp31379_c0_seq5:642-944(+)